MGGKKKPDEPGKKATKKAQEKIIEDKTFGLKNKNKSKVVQNYVKSVESQVKHGQEKGGAKAREQREHDEKKKKKGDAAAQALLASLFKNAQSMNKKGKLVDLDDGGGKIDFYKDPRAGTEDMPMDTIITCQHFLDAVENELYGWRWECPVRGVKCQYRHQLPEGYVLIPKKERDAQKKIQDELDAINNKKTLEEQIEEERAALTYDSGLTPVTKETFFAWKERRKVKKQKELEEKLRQEELEKAMGKSKTKAQGGKNSIMNGRALFTYNPDVFKNDLDDVEEEVVTKKANEPIEGKYEEEKVADDDIDNGDLDDAGDDKQINKKKKKKKGKEMPKAEEAEVDDSLFQGENGEVDEDVDFD